MGSQHISMCGIYSVHMVEHVFHLEPGLSPNFSDIVDCGAKFALIWPLFKFNFILSLFPSFSTISRLEKHFFAQI